jgi:hypothetical protein
MLPLLKTVKSVNTELEYQEEHTDHLPRESTFFHSCHILEPSCRHCLMTLDAEECSSLIRESQGRERSEEVKHFCENARYAKPLKQ